MVTQGVANTKRNRKRKRAYIPRRTRKFQLRNNHSQDIHVAEILDYARSKRQEVTLIRNAVQLEYSLGQGDLSILLERFPWVKEALSTPAPPPPDNTDLLNEILANQRELLARGIGDMLPVSPIVATGKPLGGLKPLSLPIFEEDENEFPTLNIVKSNDTSSASNLVRSLRQIQ